MNKWLYQVKGLVLKEWYAAVAKWFLFLARMVGAMAFVLMGAFIIVLLDGMQGPRVKTWTGSRPRIGVAGVSDEMGDQLEAFLDRRGVDMSRGSIASFKHPKQPGVLAVTMTDPLTTVRVAGYPRCNGEYTQQGSAWVGKCVLRLHDTSSYTVGNAISYPAQRYRPRPWDVQWPGNMTVRSVFDYSIISHEISTMQLAWGLSVLNDFVVLRANGAQAMKSMNIAYYFPGKEQSGWVKVFVGFTVYFGLWSLSVAPAQRIYEERHSRTRELLRWSGTSETAYAMSHVVFTLLTSMPFILTPGLILGWAYVYSSLTCITCLCLISCTIPAMIREWKWCSNLFSISSFVCVAMAYILGPTEYAIYACINPAVAFFFSWPIDETNCFSWTVKASQARTALAIDVVLCAVMAWYLVQVRPAEQGGKPWLFPFQRKNVHKLSSLKLIRTEEVDLEASISACSSCSMQPDPPGHPAIECEHVTKRYPGATSDVLKDFSLTVKEGEIYALLGRNGAGKSTFIKMLTGCLSPGSYQTASLCGYDIATEMEHIKEDIGLCLQTDVLWPSLTPEQHIHVISSLRNVPDQLELLDALSIPQGIVAGALSGGLQRRLCIAMALIGKPKVIILDEPCASLDPIGRMKTWKLLGQYREAGCTVLVTTQHVDEAAQLGDRIGIMEKGVIRCSGDVDFLDSMFWKSHTITATMTPGKRFDPERLGLPCDKRGKDLFMKINTEKEVVGTLEKLEAEEGVENITLGTTGLEDAFMSVGDKPEDTQQMDFSLLPAVPCIDVLTQLEVISDIRLKTFLRSRSQVLQRLVIVFTISVVSLITHKMDCSSRVMTDNSFFVVDNVGVHQSLHATLRDHAGKNEVKLTELALNELYSNESSCTLSTPVGMIIDSVQPRNVSVLLMPTASTTITSFMLDVLYSSMYGIDIKNTPSRESNTHSTSCSSDIDSLTMMFGASLVTAIALQQSFGVTESARDFTRGTIHTLRVMGLQEWTYWGGAVTIDTLLLVPLAMFTLFSPILFGIQQLYDPLAFLWVMLLGVSVSLTSHVFVILFSKMTTVQVLVVVIMFVTVTSSYLPIFAGKVYFALYEVPWQPWVDTLVRNLTPASTFIYAVVERNTKVALAAFATHITVLCLALRFSLKTVVKAEAANPPHNVPDTDEDILAEKKRVAKGADPVAVTGLYKAYQPGRNALQDVTLGLERGECLGVLGPNGAGKSTLVNMISGLELPSKGSILLRKSISVCPQHDIIWDKITVAEHMSYYLRIRYGDTMSEENMKKWCDMGCSEVNFGPFRGRGEELSGGTKKKLQVMLSLFSGTEVSILDEPSAGMDPASRISLWNAIRKTISQDRSVILTTHSMKEAESVCSRIGIFVSSRLRCLGSPVHLKHRFGDGYTVTLVPSFSSRQEDEASLCSIGQQVRELTGSFSGVVCGMPSYETALVVNHATNVQRCVPISNLDHSGDRCPPIGICKLRRAFLEVFPKAVQLERRHRSAPIKYCIPSNMRLSHCYNILAENKQAWGFSSFTISQAIGLEQIFVKLANKYMFAV
eukprot:TRINITY_DN8446_c2_g2_i1.p1 TRINITY_DN8446_c2_g2~~TRINITY_DN8446_c2_g2_i1.p1  ORF type:complete len:1541 (+),score=249.03 TRINITY_DN8446_c2_g2_i1:112-4734(+)